jgi:hypothetical protein
MVCVISTEVTHLPLPVLLYPTPRRTDPLPAKNREITYGSPTSHLPHMATLPPIPHTRLRKKEAL